MDLSYLLLPVGFLAVVKGADWLIEGSLFIARKLRIPDLIIGLTIVSMGTSLPEFAVNTIASYRGNNGIALGNIIGSNICNILLILGVSSIIRPLKVQKNTVFKEIPFSLLAAMVVFILVNDVILDHSREMVLSRSDGLILFTFFAVFISYIISLGKTSNLEVAENNTNISLLKALFYLISGILLLYFGGGWVVTGATSIARFAGLDERVIGLTIVALGTSLPELVTSVMATLKGNDDISIGNVVGSNIFNIFFVLSSSALIRPIAVESIVSRDILVLIFASILLIYFLLLSKKNILSRWAGIIFLVIYFGYMTFSIFNA